MLMEALPFPSALIVVDVQNDFCPGGALAVPNGDEIVALINRLIDAFDHVVLTQDWHPKVHSSFASSHRGQAVFSSLRMAYGEQTLWPDHCVQGTPGAEFHPRAGLDQGGVDHSQGISCGDRQLLGVLRE